jgi:hypothetical protein
MAVVPGDRVGWVRQNLPLGESGESPHRAAVILFRTVLGAPYPPYMA